MDELLYLIDAVIFILLVMVCFFIVWELKKNKVAAFLQQNLQGKMKNRRKTEEDKIMEDGYGQKESLFYRLDLSLYQSGLQKKVPLLTSEIFLISAGILTTGCFAAVLFISNTLLPAVCAAMAVIFSIYVSMELLLIHNTNRIEEDILTFANLLDNYSKSTDDIVDIMDYTRGFLREPLRGAVNTFCSECRSGGDIQTAFRRLEVSIRHRIFGELIRNIEICSRYNADYSAVIRKNRVMIENYLAEREARKQLANTSRLQILILYASAGLSLKIMQEIGGTGFMPLLLYTPAGNIILILCLAVVLYSIRLMFVLGRK